MLPVLGNWQGITIYSYPLFIGLAWGIGYRISEMNLPKEIALRDFRIWFLGLFCSSWAGAKILFLLTQPNLATELATSSNFWLGGGFVFLGGLIGGQIFTWLMGQIRPNLSLWKMEFTLIPLLYGHALGRVGCFLAGCCYGTKTTLPWGVFMHGLIRHPVQLYEALGLVILALCLMLKRKMKGWLAFYLVGYGALRWSLEWLRADEIRGIWGGMSTSQWISSGMILLGILIFLRVSRKVDY